MRWLIRTLFALMLSVLLWTPAAACSVSYIEDRVACPNEAPVTAFNDEDVRAKISPACAAALGPEVLQLIEERVSQRPHPYTHPLFTSRFSVDPWSQAAEDRLRAWERDLIDCRYERWQRVGDWLVSQDAIRSYCVSTAGVEVFCPTTRLSVMGIIGVALINPSLHIWPYSLAAWLAVVGAGFWLARLARRRQLAAFLRPGWLLGLGVAAALIVVLLMFATWWVDVPAWGIILYLLACSLRWILLNAKRRRAQRVQ